MAGAPVHQGGDPGAGQLLVDLPSRGGLRVRVRQPAGAGEEPGPQTGLAGLPEEQGQVRGGGGAGDDPGAVCDQRGQVRAEIGGGLPVGGGIDQGVPAGGGHGHEVAAQQPALEVVVPQTADGAAARALPQLGEHARDVVQPPGEVVRPAERGPVLGAACVEVRLPGERGRHAGDAQVLAGVGDGGQHLGAGHGEDDLRPFPAGELPDGPAGRRRVGAAVADRDPHPEVPPPVAKARQARRQRAQDERQGFPEGGQPPRHRHHGPDARRGRRRLLGLRHARIPLRRGLGPAGRPEPGAGQRSTVMQVVLLSTETVSLPQLLLCPEALRAKSRLERMPPPGPATSPAGPPLP